ncbi:hypothetical protein ABK040_004985 [Willaertia magna]
MKSSNNTTSFLPLGSSSPNYTFKNNKKNILFTILLFIITIQLLITKINSEIFPFHQTKFYYNSYIIKRFGIYTKDYVKNNLLILNNLKNPYISIDLTLTNIENNNLNLENIDHSIYVSIIHSDELEQLYLNSTTISKNSITYKNGEIKNDFTTTNTAITTNHGNLFTNILQNLICKEEYSNNNLYFLKIQNSNKIQIKRNEFTKSGIYYIIILNCNNQLQQINYRLMNGYIKYVNPFGYINGEYYNYIPFYGIISLITLFIGIIYIITIIGGFECKRPFTLHLWNSLSFSNNRTVTDNNLKIESYAIIVWICFLFILFLFENSFYYFYYEFLNIEGNNNHLFYTLSSFFHILRITFSRIFILLLCMGYGSIRNYLGNFKQFLLIIFGFIYFLSNLGNEIVNLLFLKVHLISPFIASLISLPNIILDIIVTIWIFIELIINLKYLKNKQQLERLNIFIKLFFILFLNFILTIIISFFYQFHLFNNLFKNDKLFEINWTYDIYWTILFLFIFILIMFLMTPRNLGKVQQFMDKELKYMPINRLNNNSIFENDLLSINSNSNSNTGKSVDSNLNMVVNNNDNNNINNNSVMMMVDVQDGKRPGFILDDDDSEDSEDGSDNDLLITTTTKLE